MTNPNPGKRTDYRTRTKIPRAGKRLCEFVCTAAVVSILNGCSAFSGACDLICSGAINDGERKEVAGDDVGGNGGGTGHGGGGAQGETNAQETSNDSEENCYTQASTGAEICY